MREILGNNLSNLFKALKGEMTYKGKKYEVWKMSDNDCQKMCDMTEEELARFCPNGWWRSADGSVLGIPDAEYEINGISILAWDGETRKELAEEYRMYSDEEVCVEDPMTCLFEREYESLTAYLCGELGASMEKNIIACATDLAKYNNIPLGELFEKYEGVN